MKKKRLTGKEKAFTEVLINNPKLPRYKAVKIAYDTKNDVNARNMASQLMNRPHIQSALAPFSELFEGAIVNTVKEWKDSPKTREREIAMQNAQWGHDKIHGRSRQQVDVTTTGVTLNLDLTSSLAADDSDN